MLTAPSAVRRSPGSKSFCCLQGFNRSTGQESFLLMRRITPNSSVLVVSGKVVICSTVSPTSARPSGQAVVNRALRAAGMKTSRTTTLVSGKFDRSNTFSAAAPRTFSKLLEGPVRTNPTWWAEREEAGRWLLIVSRASIESRLQIQIQDFVLICTTNKCS